MGTAFSMWDSHQSQPDCLAHTKKNPSCERPLQHNESTISMTVPGFKKYRPPRERGGETRAAPSQNVETRGNPSRFPQSPPVPSSLWHSFMGSRRGLQTGRTRKTEGGGSRRRRVIFLPGDSSEEARLRWGFSPLSRPRSSASSPNPP